MSIKGRLNNYLNPVDYSTEGETYSAEELADTAAEILGEDTFKTIKRGVIITRIEEEPMYEVREDVGVIVKSRRREAYNALDQAVETLSEDDEDLLEP